MHWAERIARDIIEKHPEREIYTCASGISPSGAVHIGNFREIVTTWLVVRALQDLGKRTRFIFSWDDYDRLRKVPANIDPAFEEYIGLPYSDIPDPYGCHGSYAAHFEKQFETALKSFGIEVEFIYQNEMYRNGCYTEEIIRALDHRRQIYDILMRFKTQAPSGAEREAYYPVSVYCESCGRDLTTTTGYDEAERSLSYTCRCGHAAVIHVPEAGNVKLNWKVDWPMRWMREDVVFEPGGRDHSSETGSYNVSKVIVKEIFGHEPPEYVAYEFIGIKGGSGKMSSSSGNVLTPGDLLGVYTPEVLMFIFTKYAPGAAFNIGLDQDVIRNYSEYERWCRQADEGIIQNSDMEYALSLIRRPHEGGQTLSFSQAVGLLPLIDYDLDVFSDAMARFGSHVLPDQIERIGERAEFWIRSYSPERHIEVRRKFNTSYYETLVADDRECLRDLAQVLKIHGHNDESGFMRQVYDICSSDDAKLRKASQKRLFKHVYNMVLGQDSGPRIPLLIEAVGVDRFLSLIEMGQS